MLRAHDSGTDRYRDDIEPVTIFHNPRCSKSRAALGLLESSPYAVEVCRYLETTPTPERLRWLAQHLDGPLAALIRREGVWNDLGVTEEDLDDVDRVVAILSDHIELLERPLIVIGDRVVIGRPIERVAELLED